MIARTRSCGRMVRLRRTESDQPFLAPIHIFGTSSLADAVGVRDQHCLVCQAESAELFLGSWRSTIVVAISIPLSVLASLAVLSALGETINLMTLGGLALAVGILVDDATVTIENIERHMGLGEKLEDAILKGAGEIALPALVSTFCICIVFIPMFFLSGVAHYLFVPFAEAVVFAVIASYVLSRTLVPTLVMWFERHNQKSEKHGHVTFWVRPFVAFQHAF